MNDNFTMTADTEGKTRVGPRVPGARQASVLVLLSLTLCVTVGLVLQRVDLLPGIVATEVVCLAAPLFAGLLLGRYSIAGTLQLRWPGWRAMGLAFLMAPAAALAAGQVFWMQSLIVPVPAWYLEMMDSLARTGRETHLWLGIVGLSVLPALCEEGVFRGFVLSGFTRRLGTPGAVWLSGLFFAILHLDIYRFLAVCLLGAFLAYLVVLTRSLYPAVLVHSLNNLLVLAPPEWAELDGMAWLASNDRAPVAWIAGGIAVVAAGCVLLARTMASRRDPDQGASAPVQGEGG